MGLLVRGGLTTLRPAAAEDVDRLVAWHADPEVSRVTVDPYAWNEAAIRSWERAGFVEISRGHPPDDDHAAEWVLMEFVG